MGQGCCVLATMWGANRYECGRGLKRWMTSVRWFENVLLIGLSIVLFDATSAYAPLWIHCHGTIPLFEKTGRHCGNNLAPQVLRERPLPS